MTQDDWATNLAYGVGREVRRHRTRLKWSAERLAAECERVGMRIERSVLANLENQRRISIAVAEVIVLAKALGVPPAVLLYPVGDTESVEVLPGRTVPPWAALKWFAGSSPLNKSDLDAPELAPRNVDINEFKEYMAGTQQLERYRRYEKDANHLINLYYEIQEAPHRKPTKSGKNQPATPEEIARLQESLETLGSYLGYQRDEMRKRNMVLPELPEELHRFDSGEPETPTWDVPGSAS